MRYHSLIAERQSLPAQLEISAENDEGIIMAVQHRQWPIYAVQYHPESILSEHGHAQIELFIKTLGCESVTIQFNYRYYLDDSRYETHQQTHRKVRAISHMR